MQKWNSPGIGAHPPPRPAPSFGQKNTALRDGERREMEGLRRGQGMGAHPDPNCRLRALEEDALSPSAALSLRVPRGTRRATGQAAEQRDFRLGGLWHWRVGPVVRMEIIGNAFHGGAVSESSPSAARSVRV